MVKNILDGVITNKDYEFEGILKSPVQWEYRNKMNFHLEMNIKMALWHWDYIKRQFLRYCYGKGM